MTFTVRTLVFSDIEGSTGLLERAGQHWPGMLQRHRRIIRAAIADWNGVEHGTEGDSFFVTFGSPSDALAAVVQAQIGLETADWPDGLQLRVRMGLHLGGVAELDDDLVGLTIHHAARVAATAHGGQIVVSEPARAHSRVLPATTTLQPLGVHRLRDVGTIALYQVGHPQLQRSFPELRGVLGSRTNLPRPTTEFVGAERLIADLDDLVRRSRVITLTGTGGVGKTRSAIEFGWRRIGDFPDGIYFVDLSPVTDEGAVPAALAATLSLVAAGEQPLLDLIVNWIGDRRLLFVIDNCEHLVAEVAAVVSAFQSRCSNAVMLATSREALGVQGERVVRVPSLEAGGEATTLLCERARDADSSFDPAGHEAVLEQICRRLDGIPLAIELAAARMRSLSPEELLDRLQDRFRLLRGSGRGTLERHQTLRAMVSWSYQLLTADQQRLFERLSVFSGGFDLRAAERVCGLERSTGSTWSSSCTSSSTSRWWLPSGSHPPPGTGCSRRSANSPRSSSNRTERSRGCATVMLATTRAPPSSSVSSRDRHARSKARERSPPSGTTCAPRISGRLRRTTSRAPNPSFARRFAMPRPTCVPSTGRGLSAP